MQPPPNFQAAAPARSPRKGPSITFSCGRSSTIQKRPWWSLVRTPCYLLVVANIAGTAIRLTMTGAAAFHALFIATTSWATAALAFASIGLLTAACIFISGAAVSTPSRLAHLFATAAVVFTLFQPCLLCSNPPDKDKLHANAIRTLFVVLIQTRKTDATRLSSSGTLPPSASLHELQQRLLGGVKFSATVSD